MANATVLIVVFCLILLSGVITSSVEGGQKKSKLPGGIITLIGIGGIFGSLIYGFMF